jgi:hypothetical protein
MAGLLAVAGAMPAVAEGYGRAAADGVLEGAGRTPYAAAGPWATSPATLQAQPQLGEITGETVDFDGTPLRGVTVELVGPFPEDTSRTQQSGANARFAFTQLLPGRYRLSIKFPEVDAAGDLDVTVNPGMRTETTLVLSLMAMRVNVIVQAQAPAVSDTDLTDIEATSGLRALPGTIIESFPLPAEQALEVLPLLPTVVRGPKGEIAIDGTMPADSVLLFNGVDLTDGYSGNFDVRLPIEAIDRIDVFTGLAPAEYGNFAGGVIDVRTLAGGESWDWRVASFLPRPRIEDGTIRGIKGASPRLRIGGPLKGGEAYLSLAGEYHFDRVEVYEVPGDPDQDHVREEGWNGMAQIDWQPDDRHRFTLSALSFPRDDRYVGLDGLTPPEATFNVERGAEALFVRHAFRPDEDRSLEATLQFNRIDLRTGPQGPDPFEVTPDGYGGNQFHAEDRRTTHFQSQVVHSRRISRDDSMHVLQMGIDLHRLYTRGTYENDTILVLGSDGRLLQRIDFGAPVAFRRSKYEWAAFVQDRWTRSERFWLDLGLRYSGDSLTGDHGIAPRVGVAFDPAGDRRTLLKAAAGLIYRRVYLGELLWDELPVRLETAFSTPDGPRLAAYVPRRAAALDPPRTLLLTTELSHRTGSGWLFRSRYSYRRSGHDIIADRVEGGSVRLAPGADPLASYLQTPDFPAGSLLLSNGGRSTSWSVELTAARRIPTGGEVVVSYVRSSSFGDLNDFTLLAGEAPGAVFRPNRRGPRPFDAPHRVVAWATLELPARVQLTPVVEWHTGFPYSVFTEGQAYAGDANRERFPDFFALDVQATKAVEIRGYLITAGVKVSNVTGHDNPRQVVSNLASPLFGDLRNSVPIKLRAKLSFDF